MKNILIKETAEGLELVKNLASKENILFDLSLEPCIMERLL